ncbi:MAG: DMT family transporter, partial [Candidatus Marinimicrobia bacterium]|nr:DMT family transporter [Candidatus Neomarinimicrobiota bacterium]
FCILSLFTKGTLFPVDFPMHAWIWLGLSGLIGFALGDLFLFKAFVEIGPRLSMLIMTLTAPISALLGLTFLGEIYSFQQWLGMLLTLIGVSWVILERSNNIQNNTKREIRKVTKSGIIYAFLGTLGQATGYVLSKYGMMINNDYLEPFAATQIRVIVGTIGFIIIISLNQSWPKVFIAIRNISAMGFMFGGAFLGPFLGVSLSLLALHYITAGVASTITALVPILIIPSVMYIGKEHVSLRAFAGAIIAVAGVFLLFIKF